MTVSELITKLQDLPGDMQIQVMTAEGNGPDDIMGISRGSWTGETEDEDIDDGGSWCSMIDPEDAEFIQDEENGKIAVLVVW